MKRLIVIMVSLFITACATTEKPIKVVYDIPNLELPPDPPMPTKELTDKSTPAEVMKAWIATANAYRGWNVTVRRQIDESK